MATAVTTNTSRDDVGKLLLRLTISVLLLLHGIAKVKGGIGWMGGMLGGLGLPAFIGYGVYVGEVVAPLLAIAGKFTRLAGLVIAFNMFAAIVLALRDKVFSLNQGGGWAIELEVLFLLGGVMMFFFGSGRYAVSKGVGRWD